MALKSVAYTRAEQKERNSPDKVNRPYEGDKYPYGLCIDLNEQTMEKLGLDALPKAGSEVTLTARCTVKSVSMDERSDGEKSKRMSLQITAMDVKKGGAASMEDAVSQAIDEEADEA